MHQLFQILYSEQTWAARDEGFIALDNRSNERPDWREYWPIRDFLRSTTLKEDDLYGFFSPKFTQKTGLRPNDIGRFIDADKGQSDVYLFSPYFDQIALFQNCFEQGDTIHPQLSVLAQQAFDAIGYPINIPRLVGSSLNTVFCNYFVASARFWREWLRLGDAIFALAETASTLIGKNLNQQVPYLDHALPAKIFVVERLVAALLAQPRSYRVRSYLCAPTTWAHEDLQRAANDMYLLDSLKSAHVLLDGQGPYLRLFYGLRERITSALLSKRAG